MLIFSSCLISLLGGNYGKVFVISWKRYSYQNEKGLVLRGIYAKRERERACVLLSNKYTEKQVGVRGGFEKESRGEREL